MGGQKRQAGSHAPGCTATGMQARQGQEEGLPGAAWAAGRKQQAGARWQGGSAYSWVMVSA